MRWSSVAAAALYDAAHGAEGAATQRGGMGIEAMTFRDGWICKACWKSNRQQDPSCLRCKTPRDADDAAVEAARAAKEAAATHPEAVPDIVVALPVWVFRGYARVWQRGGIGVMALLLIIAFGGVTDLGYLGLTAAMGAGLFISGILAGEASEAMRDREVWAYLVGIGLAVVGAIGSVFAFETLAPGLADPIAIRWGSLLVFGGAGLAAIGGLVMMYLRRER